MKGAWEICVDIETLNALKREFSNVRRNFEIFALECINVFVGDVIY